MSELPDFWRLSVAAGIEDDPRGNAFVVDEQRALTCTHVLDEQEIWLRRLGHPAVPWRLDAERVSTAGPRSADVSVLPLPKGFGSVTAPLGAWRRPEEGTRVKAFGFPDRGSTGEWAEAAVMGPSADGRWLQLTDRSAGSKITQGYSGGAAVDALTHLVVGMIVWASLSDNPTRNSWLVPLDVLAADVTGLPELLAADYAAEGDYVAARRALSERRYDEAAHLFFALAQRNPVADLLYYAALARLRGRAPHEHSHRAIEDICEMLRRSRDLDAECVQAAALWAVVKEDYYRLQGLPVGVPTIDELNEDLSKISRLHADEIVAHVHAPSCGTWRLLRHRSSAGPR
jgi:hypothetical protein